MNVKWNDETICITLSRNELEVELADLGIELNAETCQDDAVLTQLANYCLDLCAQARPETLQLINTWGTIPLVLQVFFSETDAKIILRPVNLGKNVSPTELMPDDIEAIDYDLLGQEDWTDYLELIGETVTEDEEAEGSVLSEAEKDEIKQNVHEASKEHRQKFEQEYANSGEITDEYIDSSIEYYLRNVMQAHPDVSYQQMLNTLQLLPMFYQYLRRETHKLGKNITGVKKAQEIRKFIEAYRNRVKRIYDSLVVTYFYKMPDVHIALRAIKTVSCGSLLYVKNTYYILTNYYSLSLLEYGNQVDSFIYVDDSVIGYIKDGELVSKKG